MSRSELAGGGSPAGAGAWHASPALLAAYARGRTASVDAWSVELHLTSCALCRAELALALPAGEQAVLDELRRAVMTDLPGAGTARSAGRRAPGRAPARRRLLSPGLPAHVRWVLRPAAPVAVVLAVAVAVGLDAVSRWRVASSAGLAGLDVPSPAGGLLWLLAPALPLAGVAVCSVREGDPWGEAVLATPSAGLRLTLWRTAVVLALAVPLAAGSGQVLGTPMPALWLLPCLALTCTALALGTVVALERAAVAVAVLWCSLVLGPAVAASGGDAVMALRRLALSARHVPALLAGPSQTVWAAVAAVSLVILTSRRARYEQLPRAGVRSRA